MAPTLTFPRVGEPIADTEDLSYSKRVSAERQAEFWNEDIPSDTGYRVGVGPRTAGRYPLVWVAAERGIQ